MMMMGLIRYIFLSIRLRQGILILACCFGFGSVRFFWVWGSNSVVCIMRAGSGFGGICVIVYR
jgi:hypothetical protein